MKIEMNRMFVDDEIRKAVMETLESGRYVKGPMAGRFEDRFKELTGSRYAISCSSGSSALMLAFKAIGISSGDEVIVPSHTFAATINGFWHFGARPRFVDIDPETFTMDPELVKEAITSRTRAIAPVHIYGHPVEMGPILDMAYEHDLKVVCDAAQSHGAIYKGRDIGVMGDITCYSFFPSKIVTVAGEGGMVTTDNEELYETMLALRNHGRLPAERDVHHMAGFNMRLPEILSAVGSVQLKHMDEWIERRREIARRYDEGLERIEGLTLPVERPWAKHVYYLYVVRTDRRDELKEHLKASQIDTAVHYPVPVHRMPYIDDPPWLPKTEQAVKEILSLPLHPLLGDDEADRVIGSVRSFFKG
ncbi:MAG: DegT/DnrJ/EryC1/StrS family aminotransferase [Candidatus Thermoplasmatota archaeon]|nr:DegT/DnrJ/EryC1/StrS family aminotransferase [Candidatus Thermoplasmatota archaeon]